MAYTTPTTRSTGDLINASIWNTDLVDNLEAIKNPPTDSYDLTTGSYSTSSGTFVDVDGTNLSLTITTTGGDVLVGFHGTITGANSLAYFDIEVDGTREGGSNGIIEMFCTSTNDFSVSFVRLITGLSAGSHTFKLQWRRDTANITLRTGTNEGQFWVREVS